MRLICVVVKSSHFKEQNIVIPLDLSVDREDSLTS